MEVYVITLNDRSNPEVIEKISCLTQLGMKF